MSGIVSLLAVAFRIYAIYYCLKKARQLNRNPAGWGVLAFFFPLVGLIVMSTLKPVYNTRPTYSENDPIDKI